MEDPEPRWLDPDEQQAWLSLLAVTMWLPAALDAQLRRDADISQFEYGVLAQLSWAPDGIKRMSELAHLSNSTLPRLSKVVDRLERHGWVSRRPDPADGRYTLAVLNEAGREKVRDTAPGHVEQVRRLVFDRLNATQARQLGAVMAPLAKAVRPQGQWW